MSVVVISYRRADSGGHANNLYDELVSRLGRDNVFLDRGSIVPGEDWQARIAKTIERAEIVVALIGRHWRVDHSTSHHDHVYFELATAFRLGKKVIPVLVEGAALPQAPDVPAELANLPGRQALWLDPLSVEGYRRSVAAVAASVVQVITSTGTVRVTLPAKFGGNLAKMQVWIDGRQAGLIGNGETAAYSLPVGPHEVFVRNHLVDSFIGFGRDQRSPAAQFLLQPGETVSFQVRINYWKAARALWDLSGILFLDRVEN